MLVLALIVALAQTQPDPPRPNQRAPIPPASTWDGVVGFEDVVTDPVTGQITYPMGRQPEKSLSRGCVFGVSNVRCPPQLDIAAYGREVMARNARSAPANGGSSSAPAARIDCADSREEARPGQRLCTFDEALSNSYIDRPATTEQAAPEQPANRNGCRRVEYRYPDGSGGGVRWECSHTTGSGPAADALSQTLQPPR